MELRGLGRTGKSPGHATVWLWYSFERPISLDLVYMPAARAFYETYKRLRTN